MRFYTISNLLKKISDLDLESLLHFLQPFEDIVAIDGPLNPEIILKAYNYGFFPWSNEGDPIIWYGPRQRPILKEYNVSRDVKKLLKDPSLIFKRDVDFKQTILNCKTTGGRSEIDGTWITSKLEEVFIKLHQMNYAHSYEIWQEGNMIGGLYGLQKGQVFFGESMFSLKPSMSKLAHYYLIETMADHQIKVIDAQYLIPFTESLGYRNQTREDYFTLFNAHLDTKIF
jgi:leucyl/phenylalanyl-tRNA--protein transferase